MKYAEYTGLTDSLERELLRKELDAYNRSAPVLDISSFIIAGLRRLQSEAASYATSVSKGMDQVRKDGHEVNAA